MKVLSLDISTNAGWALFDKTEGSPVPLWPAAYGNVYKDKTVLEYGPYPACYRLAAKALADKLLALVEEYRPDIVVVEETNQGKNRYTQKLLEWIHLYFQLPWDTKTMPELVYISSSTWRSTIGARMSSDDKKNNAKLSKAKKKAAAEGISETAAKKALGVKGRRTKKHVAINTIKSLFPESNFKVKDNDICEAILLGLAYLAGAPICTGE